MLNNMVKYIIDKEEVQKMDNEEKRQCQRNRGHFLTKCASFPF